MTYESGFAFAIVLSLFAPWASAQGTVDPAKEAIANSDLTGAIMRNNAIQLYAGFQLGHGPAPAAPVNTPKRTWAPFPPGDIVELLALADGVNQAILANDMLALFKSSVALSKGLLHEHVRLQATPLQRLAQEEAAVNGATAQALYGRLPDLARTALQAGDLSKATSYSNELLAMAGSHPEWRQGDAVFFGNAVLGEVALQQGNTGAAAVLLLAAGKSAGSPRLGSFGPSMKLAADLLAHGGEATVLEFLSECKLFWDDDQGRINRWSQAIRDGKAPDFKPNIAF